jgi:hypothetical protein
MRADTGPALAAQTAWPSAADHHVFAIASRQDRRLAGQQPRQLSVTWRPIKETGGTWTLTLFHPNWTFCAPTSAPEPGTGNGTDGSDGSAYSLSGGVQSSGTIGINLSVKTR